MAKARLMDFPTVSVIIPVRNEAKRIRQCIEGILHQTVPVQEIIVIDSGSTDGTLEILAEFPELDVIHIDSSSFNHGLTRNLGVARATSEFCQLTVGDAYAYNEFWLEEMLNGFVDDQVQAVCGQQVVDHLLENNPTQWFRPATNPKLQIVQAKNDEWRNFSPEQRLMLGGWDDVNAMYRRTALLSQPFRRTNYSEDIIWLNECLENNGKVVYNRAARVYHYHNESFDFAYRRTLTTHYFRYRIYGSIPVLKHNINPVKSFLRRIKLTFWSSGMSPVQALKWWRYESARIAGRKRGTREFIAALNQGEEALDAHHANVCGKPPIPVK